MEDRRERFRSARADRALTVLEGFHPLKHAIRFGAEVIEIAARADTDLAGITARLAPDLGDPSALVTRVSEETFETLVRSPVSTGIVAIARRPPSEPPGEGRVVLLEEPRRLENVGAAIRVAAAAGAAGVRTTGSIDPWHPVALRASAGLHFALPVASLEPPGLHDRPLIAFDPGGDELAPDDVPAHATLAFGTEREGLSEDLLGRADARVRIPMRDGVSSLNLATAVAVALYARSSGDRR